MLVKTKAIVISALKFQEKSLIVKCFTQTDGVKSYFVRDAFSHRKNNQKIAYFQPLTLLEVDAVHKNKGTLETFREIRLSSAYLTVNTDIVKSTIAMFLSEVLHHSIREEENNSGLFEFLESALLWFDAHERTPDFHLILMLEITRYFGFYPAQGSVGDYFEMIEGTFSPDFALTCLTAEDTALLKRLLSVRFNDATGFNSIQRQSLLNILIDYYSFHLDGFKRPKSLDVLKAVFS
ncbi:MAG: DNA repair protein RecO [Flavobacterium sp.]|nr:DNA repair protein RecO [Flavobacterium sp.]